jgi:hypothetical protein
VDSLGQTYWGLNGKKLINYEQSARSGLGLHKFGGDFWAISLGGYEGRYQKINLAGQLAFGDTGIVLSDDTYLSTALDQYGLYLMKTMNSYDYVGSKLDTMTREHWSNHPFIHRGSDGGYDVIPDGSGGLYIVINYYRTFPTDWVILQRIYPDGYVGGDTVEISDEEPPLLPKVLSLKAYPNPFNSSVNISFNMPVSGDAEITIFDDLGRIIDTIKLENLPSGQQKYTWGYQNRDLKLVSSVYFISVQTSGYRENCAITLLK